MGYTHYFEQGKPVTKEQWDNITNDAKKLIEHVKVHNDIHVVSDIPTKKMFSASSIILNDRDDSYETFYLRKKSNSYDFCKTNQKPYDLLVCAILMVAHHHAPGAYSISSDGNSEDWAEASQLNAKVLGYAYRMPPSLQDQFSAAIEEESHDLANSFINTPPTKRFKF